LKERVTLVESESTTVMTRRPGIDEDPLLLARKEKEIPTKRKPILIVDDERNIRLTLSQSLEILDVETDRHEEEALSLQEGVRPRSFGSSCAECGDGGASPAREVPT
jgi:hypothetical protein